MGSDSKPRTDSRTQPGQEKEKGVCQEGGKEEAGKEARP